MVGQRTNSPNGQARAEGRPTVVLGVGGSGGDSVWGKWWTFPSPCRCWLGLEARKSRHQIADFSIKYRKNCTARGTNYCKDQEVRPEIHVQGGRLFKESPIVEPSKRQDSHIVELEPSI